MLRGGYPELRVALWREVSGRSCVNFSIILLQCHILARHSWKVDGKAVGAGSSPGPVFGGRAPGGGG